MDSWTPGHIQSAANLAFGMGVTNKIQRCYLVVRALIAHGATFAIEQLVKSMDTAMLRLRCASYVTVM